MGETLRLVFWQLLAVYVVIVLFISFNVIPQYAFHFEALAFVIAIVGIARKEKLTSTFKVPQWLIIVALGLIILTRIVSFFKTPIPLGYDAAFYHAVIDQYAAGSVDKWFVDWSPAGLFVITNIFKFLGVQTQTLLTFFMIFLQVLLGLSVYVFAKHFFNKNTGIFSILLFAVSFAQFRLYEYAYIKNCLALILLLIAFVQLDKKYYLQSGIIAIFMAGLHRPTFLIFGLCYLVHTARALFDRKLRKKAFLKVFIAGCLILGGSLIFYLNSFYKQVFSFWEQFRQGLIGSGSFLGFEDYLFNSLAYLPLSFLGFFYLFKHKKFNYPFYFFAITLFIVFFKILFYNRFIVFLDIAGIVCAAYALSIIIQERKVIGIGVSVIVILSMCLVTVNEANTVQPDISETEYNFMSSIPKILPENSTIISNMVDDAHWLEALSQRTVVAPGLFEHAGLTKSDWDRYWNADSFEEIKDIMKRYNKPVFIYLGEKSKRGNINKFQNCTKLVKQDGEIQLLKYTC